MLSNDLWIDPETIAIGEKRSGYVRLNFDDFSSPLIGLSNDANFSTSRWKFSTGLSHSESSLNANCSSLRSVLMTIGVLDIRYFQSNASQSFLAYLLLSSTIVLTCAMGPSENVSVISPSAFTITLLQRRISRVLAFSGRSCNPRARCRCVECMLEHAAASWCSFQLQCPLVTS